MTMRPLRDHQVSAMAMLRQSLGTGHLAPMFQASTGFGKTRVMAEITLGALAKGKRVLIIVPALSLVDQTVAALRDEGIDDIGVIQGIHEMTNSAAPVQVASVQTLAKRKMPICDIVLVDEAHCWFKFYEKMIADSKAIRRPVIGLSATPWAKGLGKHYDDLLQVISTEELIQAGFLSRFKVFAPSHPDLEGVRTLAGDFHEGDLAEAMNKPDLVADVVSTWQQRAEQRPTLCFAVDRAHAKELQNQFLAAGIPAGYIDAHTDREERARIRHRFHAGEIKVVCNVGTMTKGIDWDVRCIILARPTKSEMLFVQIIGRGLRTAPGKDDLIILDHSDSHLNLGYVTDIHHTALDDGKKRIARTRERKALPKECAKCQYLRPKKVRTCPNCGFTPEVQCEVEVEDGDLVELNRKSVRHAIEKKALVYGQLLTISKRRNYSKHWASHKFREYFGVWPNDVGWAPQCEPTPEILGWVKSREIAFAKSRRRNDAYAA